MGLEQEMTAIKRVGDESLTTFLEHGEKDFWNMVNGMSVDHGWMQQDVQRHDTTADVALTWR